MSAKVLTVVAAAGLALAAAACAGSESTSTTASPPSSEFDLEPARLVTVEPAAAAATIADPPPGLVILDVRTPEEFAEGHIAGATMLDFYDPAFGAELAALDPTVPYVLYCRSGNRSGQTLAMMNDLGFHAVEDVGGGIVAWEGAGLPVTGG